MNDKFWRVFPIGRVVLPVVHVVTTEQTLKNVALAKEAGSDGCFLVNHQIAASKLFEIYSYVFGQFPNFWIGINCLDLVPTDIFVEIYSRHINPSGVWVDSAKINDLSEDQSIAEEIDRMRQASKWPGLYFGGVAFKYQREVSDLEKISQIAARYVDVVTTSGQATGKAPDIDKVKRMKSAIEGKPLALASGITPENVNDYPMADVFLVATGVSTDFTTLNFQKLKLLIKTAKNK